MPKPASPAAVPSLEVFFQSVLQDNPFERNRVSSAAEAAVDVPSIHDGPFRQLVGLARHTLRKSRGVGAVLWGEAGVGKSHLIARLQRWAETITNGKRNAFYVSLHNAHVRPERLPRYILKSTLSALTGNRASRLWDTELYRLISASLKAALAEAHANLNQTLAPKQLRSALGKYLQSHSASVSGDAVDDNDIHQALLQFYLGGNRAKRHVADESLAQAALRWLSGDSLRAEEVERLGFTVDRRDEETPGLQDDQAIERTLLALLELARLREQPFVLCFDQVENLSDDGFQALARFSHALLDHASNLLLVTSGVHKELAEFRGDASIPESSWARIAEERVLLNRVTEAQARTLVQARLERAFDPFVDLDPVKSLITETDLYFPLGETWLNEKLAESVEFKPRDVISWCKARFAQQQSRLQELGGDAWLKNWQGDVRLALPKQKIDKEALAQLIDSALAQRLDELAAKARDDGKLASPDADFWSDTTEALLARLAEAGVVAGCQRPRSPRPGMKPTYHLVVEKIKTDDTDSRLVGITFLCTSSATSAAGSLRRMRHDAEPPQRVLLVTDERLPPELGTAGEGHLSALREQEAFVELQMTADDSRRLYALLASLDEAHSGDLEVEFEDGARSPIDREAALASHLRTGRLAAHPLFAAILADVPTLPRSAPADNGETLEIDTETEGEPMFSPVGEPASDT